MEPEMQKSNNEVVESVLMAIPADLLEEVGIDLYSTIQMSVSRGRIIIAPVDEEESTFHSGVPMDPCAEDSVDEDIPNHRQRGEDYDSLFHPAGGGIPAG